MSVGDSRGVNAQKYPGLGEKPTVEFDLVDEEQTRLLGRWLIEQAEVGDFIGLIGNLGAGKTTMVQGIVAAADPFGNWQATSPTYALVQEYETTPRIVHMDLYRLEGWDDLESIGYWDYLDARRDVICVEWLDRISGAWPGRGIIVEVIRQEEGRRVRLWTDTVWSGKVEKLEVSVLEKLRERSN